MLDLPVRFTCEPRPGDRLKGVFTNARGWLRGWELTTEEEQRIAQLPEAEVALRERPVTLYIEMVNPHKDLELINGRRIYILRPVWKPWYKDGDARQVQAAGVDFRLHRTSAAQPMLTVVFPWTRQSAICGIGGTSRIAKLR